MTEDKRQNHLVNDRLVNGAQDDTFLVAPEGTVSYARLFDAMDRVGLLQTQQIISRSVA
jgi:hypothetical protein